MTKRSLLDIADLSSEEIGRVLDLALRAPSALGQPLAGAGAALLFEKPSTRTRHSFEMAVHQLGGHPIYTRGDEIGIDVREPAEDIARIMAGYHAVIAARVFDHGVLQRMHAAVGDQVCIVNLLSDRSHPLQAIADALTMREEVGELSGRHLAWIGDYNNVARSLGEIAARCSMSITFAGPSGYVPDRAELTRLTELGALEARATQDPFDAVVGAVAIHTDTWVSMGDEAQATERRLLFSDYQVTDDHLRAADPDAIFMHCLPAYRGLEVTAEVIDGPRSRVIRQGHNRLHAARAALAFVLGESTAEVGR